MNDRLTDRGTSFDSLPEVNGYEEIPEFSSEEEEARFWGTHRLGPGLLERMKSRPVSEILKERRKLSAQTARPHRPRASDGRQDIPRFGSDEAELEFW